MQFAVKLPFVLSGRQGFQLYCVHFSCKAFHYQTAVSDMYSARYRQNYGTVSSNRNDVGVDGECRYIYHFP